MRFVGVIKYIFGARQGMRHKKLCSFCVRFCVTIHFEYFYGELVLAILTGNRYHFFAA